MKYFSRVFGSNSFGRREFNMQGEGCALPGAFRLRENLSAVHFCQRISDCKTETQSSVTPRGRTVGLPETIKHVRQKFWIDADSGVGYYEPRPRPLIPRSYKHFPTGLSKLDRVGNQVPRNLLEPHRLAHHDERRWPQVD